MLKRSHAFGLFWLLAALGAGALYFDWHVESDLIGIVETHVHQVGAREDGVVRVVLSDIGAKVTEGQVLARLSDDDLDADEARLNEELESLNILIAADRERVRVDLGRLEMQTAERRAGIAERRAEWRSRLGELAGVEKEIQRLEEAESAGLGHSRELAELVIRRRGLLEYARSIANQMKSTEGSSDDEAPPDLEVLTTSLAADRFERVEEIRRELVTLAERRKFREVVAPADGYVVEVLARPGDTVEAFLPVITVQAVVARYVDVYLPESHDSEARVGQHVVVISKRPAGPLAVGTISFVYPGYLPIPERLMFRGQIAWAQRLRVELIQPNELRPGESVRVRFGDEKSWVAPVAEVQAREPAREALPGGALRPLEVPEALAGRTRFEPSGIAWLPDGARLLVVSDDTGRRGGTKAHRPWVFAMSAEGRVASEPLAIEGLEAVNDLEAVTPGAPGEYYLVASQSVNSKGKRPAARQVLLKVRVDGERVVLVSQVALWPLLAALPPDQARALGLDPDQPEAGRTLNLEAAAWRDGTLLLGLKQPAAAGGAWLWRLTDVAGLLATGALAPGQLTAQGPVDLGVVAGRRAAFSDLAFDEGGRLFALSTVPEAPEAEQEGKLVLLEPVDGGYAARVLQRWPGMKPEGLAVRGLRATVVFDEGPGAPGRIVDVDVPK
jgi:multidrug resistance efflux pump/ADP-ribose pyrophosphatase YjhB (NUDIX family)